jgi:hypothetical protein
MRNCSGQSPWKNQSVSPGGQLKRNLGWTADGSGSGSCLMENSRISGVGAELMLLRCSLWADGRSQGVIEVVGWFVVELASDALWTENEMKRESSLMINKDQKGGCLDLLQGTVLKNTCWDWNSMLTPRVNPSVYVIIISIIVIVIVISFFFGMYSVCINVCLERCQ